MQEREESSAAGSTTAILEAGRSGARAPGRRETPAWLKISLPLAFLIIAGAMVALSWRKWAGSWEDTGRELYVPWQILQGKMLYRDVAHLFGPLSQHLNAAVFKVFGPGFLPLALFNIALALMLAAAIFEFFRRTAGLAAAAAAGLTFLTLFAFSRYGLTGNFSYAFPYAHEMAHGALFSLLALLGFAAYLEKPRLPLLAAIGFSAGLVALTKAEIFLALFLALAGGFIFLWRSQQPAAGKLRLGILALAAGTAVPPMAFFIYFTSRTSAAEALGFLTFPFLAVLDPAFSDNPYYRWVTGMDRPGANSWSAFLVLLAYGGMLLGFLAHGACSRLPASSIARRPGRVLTFVLTAVVPLACFVPQALMKVAMPFPLLAAGLAVVFGIAAGRCRDKPEKFRRALPLFVFALFSLLLLLKIFFKATLWHYGFVLAMPAALLLSVVLTEHGPRLLGDRFGGVWSARALGAAILAVTIVAHLKKCSEVYALHTLPVGDGSDRMVVVRADLLAEGSRLQAALAAIEERIGKDESFAVIPEGLILNYVSRRVNPCKYVDFTPHLMAGFGEVPMLESLQRAMPDHIILIDQDTGKFGAKHFGIDYGVMLFAWIRKHYEPAAALTDPARGNARFGAILSRAGSE